MKSKYWTPYLFRPKGIRKHFFIGTNYALLKKLYLEDLDRWTFIVISFDTQVNKPYKRKLTRPSVPKLWDQTWEKIMGPEQN